MIALYCPPRQVTMIVRSNLLAQCSNANGSSHSEALQWDLGDREERVEDVISPASCFICCTGTRKPANIVIYSFLDSPPTLPQSSNALTAWLSGGVGSPAFTGI